MTTSTADGGQVAQHRDTSHQLSSSESWNSARRGSPVWRATSFAAALRVSPAAMRRATHIRPDARSMRIGRVPGRLPTASLEMPTAPPEPPATTMVTSPRGGSATASVARASSEPRRTCSWSLVSSRQRAAAPLGAADAGQVPQRRRGAPGCLEQDRGPVVGGDACQPLPALATASWQEPLERPAWCRDAADDQCRQDRRGTGDGHHPATLVRPGAHQLAARVAHQRRARRPSPAPRHHRRAVAPAAPAARRSLLWAW